MDKIIKKHMEELILILEVIKFILYSGLIVIISKYILAKTLRKLAENLNLKAKTVGNIAGVATSVPELLTIATSSTRGLTSASIYNILSSNIINLIQYLGTILINKNTEKLKNKAIITDIVLVVFTIIIPIILLKMNIELNFAIVPLFIILYAFFKFLNNNAHKLYLNKEDKIIENEIEIEKKKEIRFKRKTVKYVVILLITGVLLFFIGELLGDTLDNLCKSFNVPENVVGILLGFITSIPELITFFESQKHHKKVENDMLGVVEATNNLLTSNTLNLFIIQSIAIILT